MPQGFDIWSVIFTVIASQGLFLGVVILLSKAPASRLLGGVVLLFSLYMVYCVLYWTGYVRNLPFILNIAVGFTYLQGPLLYFYLKSDRNRVYFDWRHFVPFLVYVTLFLSRAWIPRDSWSMVATIQIIFQNLHMVVYSALMWQWIRKVDGAEERSALSGWRKRMVWSFIGYTLSFIVYYVLLATGVLKVEYDYFISLAAAALIYFAGYYGYHRPKVIELSVQEKYSRSTLSNSASKAIHQRITSYFDDECPYLDGDFRLQDLSNALGYSSHHISQIINEVEGVNFSDFVNRYRVEDAVKILQDPLMDSTKMIEVAYQTGFNNKTTFNAAFKKFVGCSPSAYRARLNTSTQTI